jgi:hypothetical protein
VERNRNGARFTWMDMERERERLRELKDTKGIVKMAEGKRET